MNRGKKENQTGFFHNKLAENFFCFPAPEDPDDMKSRENMIFHSLIPFVNQSSLQICWLCCKSLTVKWREKTDLTVSRTSLFLSSPNELCWLILKSRKNESLNYDTTLYLKDIFPANSKSHDSDVKCFQWTCHRILGVWIKLIVSLNKKKIKKH